MAEKKEEKKEEAPEVEAEAAEGGGKKKKLIIIIAAALVVVGGGGAGFFLMSGGEKHPEPEGHEAAESAPEGHGAAPAEDAHGKPTDHAKKAEAGHGEAVADGHGEAKKPEAAPAAAKQDGVGDTFNFNTFHLNLANPLENHYVRIDIAAEYLGGAEQKQEIEKRLPQLRDAIVSVSSQKTREFLLGPDGKDQLRRELLIRLNRYMKKPFEAIYITDILIE